jgi:hypothetical protein
VSKSPNLSGPLIELPEYRTVHAARIVQPQGLTPAGTGPMKVDQSKRKNDSGPARSTRDSRTDDPGRFLHQGQRERNCVRDGSNLSGQSGAAAVGNSGGRKHGGARAAHCCANVSISSRKSPPAG